MRTILLLVFICLPGLVWAEDMAVSHRVIVVGEVLRGTFSEERQLKEFKAPLRSTGHFIVAPGHGLIWSVETPFSITTVITPSGLMQETGGNQTMNLPAQRIPFLLNLYDMLCGALAGDWTALSQQFTISKSGDDAHWQALLSPLKKDDTSMPFSSIRATGGQFVEQIELHKEDGDADILTFSNQKLSTSPLTAREIAMLTLNQ